MSESQYNISLLSSFGAEVRSGFKPSHTSAYETVLNAEVRAVEIYKTVPHDKERDAAKKDVICARVVGGFLVETFARRDRLGDTPASTIVRDIISTSGQSSLARVVYDLGQFYQDKILRAFRTVRTYYPPPSSHPSRSSFDTVEDMMINNIDASGKSYATARKNSLARDGYACVVTGVWNKDSLKENPALLAKARSSGAYSAAVVETSHILKEGIMQGIDPSETSKNENIENTTRNAAGMLAALEIFGLKALVSELVQSNGVHTVKNVITLEHNIHEAFDSLDVWFDQTEEEHVYEVGSSGISNILDLYKSSRLIDFKRHLSAHSVPKEKLESLMPNPCFLALHATCARVAHMSGAAEVYDMVSLDDAKEIKVLAEDGANGDLLYHLLAPYRDISQMA